MPRSFVFTLFALFLPFSYSAAAQSDALHALADTDYHRLDAREIGRPFHIHVGLPDGYGDSESVYPAIYLLDGGSLYALMKAYSRYLTISEEMPPAILVGIGYGSDDFEGGNFRSTDYTAPSAERDYWGGADRFQSFLENELLPLVEENYRADAERRILFGQSLGGQFVLYSALTRPELFWGRIASNPALHRNLEWFLRPAEGSDRDLRLFVASGQYDDPRFREPALAWMAHWEAVAATPWTLHAVTLSGHTHMSAPPAAFRAGLAWLFGRGPVDGR